MALAGIKAKVLLMPSATDLYFQTDDNRPSCRISNTPGWSRSPRSGAIAPAIPLANPEDAAFIDKQVEALADARIRSLACDCVNGARLAPRTL